MRINNPGVLLGLGPIHVNMCINIKYKLTKSTIPRDRQLSLYPTFTICLLKMK